MELINLKTQNKPKSFTLWIYITEKCNLKCKHCYLDGSFSKNELTTKDLYKILDDYIYLLRLFNIKGRLMITGGEPLMRKDIFKFLKRISQYNREILDIGILTNGTLITSVIAKKLRKLGVSGVGLSLEGLESNNDFIRGKGTFKKIIRAVKILIDSGITPNIEFTANKLNYKEFPKVVELGEKIGLPLIAASFFVPEGRGLKMQKLKLSYSELKDYYRKARLLSQYLKNKKSHLQVYPTRPLCFLAKKTKENFICKAHKEGEFLTVMPNGDIIPCGFMPIKLGNIRQESLINVYFNSPFLKRLRHPSTKKTYPQCKFIQTYR